MTSLHHLALRTRELDRLLAFYQAWFALPLVRDQRPRAAWLAIEPAAVLMIERAELEEPGIAAGSRELIAFAVTSAEREALGRRLVDEGLLESATEHTLYFRDPDGRRVAVSSYPL